MSLQYGFESALVYPSVKISNMNITESRGPNAIEFCLGSTNRGWGNAALSFGTYQLELDILDCGRSRSVACFGVKVSVMFHLMFVHCTFSSVLVAE